MTSKFLSLIAGVSALALAGTAHAAGSVQLSDVQMDSVTAGFYDSNTAWQDAYVDQYSAPYTTNAVAAVGIVAYDVEAEGEVEVKSSNSSSVRQSTRQRN